MLKQVSNHVVVRKSCYHIDCLEPGEFIGAKQSKRKKVEYRIDEYQGIERIRN